MPMLLSTKLHLGYRLMPTSAHLPALLVQIAAGRMLNFQHQAEVAVHIVGGAAQRCESFDLVRQ